MERRETRVIEYKGHQIFGVLHVPKGEGPFPVVVVHHGFGGNKVGSDRIYVRQAEAFSRQGIATFRFDFRGCGDSEGSFQQMTVKSLVEDALHIIEKLREEPDLDLGRLGLLGASLGGSVACLVAGRVAPKSVALWAPVAQGQLWYEDYARDFPEHTMDGVMRYGGDVVGREFCDQFLELRADHVLGDLHDVPILHAHGDLDKVVYPSHADLFEEARPSHAMSRFVRFPNSCHAFSHFEERDELIGETVRWFSETL